jgi:predicted amidophosphoribosyltransferase
MSDRLRVASRRCSTPLLRLFFPALCIACDRELGSSQSHGVCLDCWTDLRGPRSAVCPTCASPLPAGSDLLGAAGGKCVRCVLRPGPASAVRAAVLYDDRAKKVLLRAKSAPRRELFGPIGAQLAASVRAWRPADRAEFVLPVPSHPVAGLRRGFAPARELARPVAAALGIPVVGDRLRRRWRGPGRLSRFGARGRRARAGAAFAWRGPRVPGATALLVDDVMTSGATAAACIEIARTAGLREVLVAVWARTPRHSGIA